MGDGFSVFDVLGNQRLILTIGFACLVFAIRWLLVRMVRGEQDILTESRRGWITQIKNAAIAFLLLGLIFIWLPEIEVFALSITAVAVAFVIATKELILCVSGTVYRASTNLFRIGDWVQIGSHFGEVIDHDWGSVTLQHVDPDEYVYTGSTITIPNSLLLTQPVVNSNFLKRFVYHSFNFTIEPDADLSGAIPMLRSVIDAHSADFVEVARRYLSTVEKRTGIDVPGHEPRFQLTTTDLGKFVIKVIIFCPRERAKDIQRLSAEAFIRWYLANRVVGKTGS